MKAVAINRTGSPDELTYMDLPEPDVGPHDIRVRAAAVAVNPVDIKTRSGFLGIDLVFPAVLGWDVSGTVDAIGEQVTQFQVGDIVMGMIAQTARGQGTYAGLSVGPEDLFAPVPNELPADQAAAVPLTTLTAAQLLDKANLASEARVLVTGAAGAVGRVTVQWLLHDGHEVEGLARPHDQDDLAQLGVAEVYTDVSEIPEHVFDAVLDTAGVADSIVAVRDNGIFFSIADNRQPRRQRGIFPSKSYVQENGARLAGISAQLIDHTLSIPVGKRYALSDAAEAHRDFEKGVSVERCY